MLIKEEIKDDICVKYFRREESDRISCLQWVAMVAMSDIWIMDEIKMADTLNRNDEGNETEWLKEIVDDSMFVQKYEKSQVTEAYVTGYYQDKEVTAGVKLNQGIYVVICDEQDKDCFDDIIETFDLK
jgi:hypothetical protein